MAATPQISTKRVAISKANAQVVGIVAAAAFVTVFCLIASKTVFSNNLYLGRVTTEKQKAHKQLDENLENYTKLRSAYEGFDGAQTNIIGGIRDGQSDRDGSNSKITLDALPSSYDFPALASSLEKILTDQGLSVSSITGTDDQVAQQTNSSSGAPKTVSMPFTFAFEKANYQSVGDLMTKIQASIRPIQVDKITLAGAGTSMQVTVDAHTYYQPAKSIDIKTKVVK